MPWIHTSSPKLKVQIRWLLHCDLPKVLDIERRVFESAWTEEDFLHCLQQRSCIGMVAEYNHHVIGFMIYKLHKAKLHILNFVVDLEFFRKDIATQMIEKLKDKLNQQRRNEICLELREGNLTAQLFFKKMGFKAALVLHNHYNDTNEDAYLMRFILNEKDTLFLPFAPHNRIAEYYDVA